jgi:inner membrane protein YidH
MSAINKTPPLDTGTKLALQRTHLAYERTLMAWVRTATSLITFGFTIYKFFEFLTEAGHVHIAGWLGPRHFAVGMIALGIIALQIATVQHRHDMAILRAEYGSIPPSLAAKLAAVVSVSGGVVLLLALFRQ